MKNEEAPHKHTPGDVISYSERYQSDFSYMDPTSTHWYMLATYKCKECGEAFIRKIVEG